MNNTPKTQTSKNTPAENQTCANCGMPQQEWRGNNGKGIQVGSKTYCCQGCATGTGCTCS